MWPFKGKKKADEILDRVKKVALSDGTEFKIDSGSDYQIASYVKDGAIDFEAYRKAQNAGNEAKLGNVFADQSVIEAIARDAAERLGRVSSILCHGTRNGAELRWFSECIPEAEVLGTDIADSASQFPNTIQWDFHDMRDDWRDRWDLIYSNSWDHAIEPLRMFASWTDSLRSGGLIYLEHTTDHLKADHLDTFGASEAALVRFVRDGSSGRMTPVGRLAERKRTALVFAKV